MDSVEYHHALAALQWQIELGATEAIGDVTVNRHDVPASVEKPKKPAAVLASPVNVRPVEVDGVEVATAVAAAAQTPEALRAAIAGFDLCDLKKGARSLVFSDGTLGGRVMIIGNAPDRYEDREGRSFAGSAGVLLDKMLAAIDMGRSGTRDAVYLSNVIPWRPLQDREPRLDEIAMMRPFLMRHISLARPDVLVLMGNGACQALLGKRGISRLRGQWADIAGVPALPMVHPEQLLRNPDLKRDAWSDLLALKRRLVDG